MLNEAPAPPVQGIRRSEKNSLGGRILLGNTPKRRRMPVLVKVGWIIIIKLPWGSEKPVGFDFEFKLRVRRGGTR